jgi:vacuolar protein sorting-associated protein 35
MSSKDNDLSQILIDLKDRISVTAKLLKSLILSSNDLTGVVKCASNIISELRNGILTPKLYYELYLDVFDALNPLDAFFFSLTRNGTPAQEIYNTVQRCPGVLQRLYLMAIAGAVLIKSKQSSARVVLSDLTEHVKGVQHPQRGLFFRYFLLQKLKDRLPDKDSDYSSSNEGSGSVDDKKDCIDFLTSNLIEMNRLWIRMQSPTNSSSTTAGIPVARNRKKRERERLELRILVGSNLTRLSALNCLDLSVYASTILPAVLAEIVSCRDKIAQAYLAEGLLQVFPLEYHLSTLSELLRMLPMLVSDHKTIKTVVCSLLSRIQEGSLVPVQEHSNSHTEASPFVSVLNLPHPSIIAGVMPRNVDAFGTILQYVSSLTSDPLGPFRPMMVGATTMDSDPRQDGDDDNVANNSVTGGSSPTANRLKSSSRLASLREAGDAAAAAQPLASLLEIFIALTSFSTNLYPGHNAYIDAVLGATGSALQDVLGLSPVNPTSVPQLECLSKNEALQSLLEASNPTSKSTASVPISLGANGVGLDDNCSQLVVTLLSSVHSAATLDVLELKSYPTLVQPLSFRFRRNVAAHLLSTVINLTNNSSSPLRDVQVVDRLFSALFPLIREDGATPADALPAEEENKRFIIEQTHLTRLLELLSPSGFEALSVARDYLSWGGSKRVRLTYPSLLKQVLSLKGTAESKAIYILAHELCATVALANYAEVALEMFVEASSGFENKYKDNLLSQARLLYQDLLLTTKNDAVCLKFGARLASGFAKSCSN